MIVVFLLSLEIFEIMGQSMNMIKWSWIKKTYEFKIVSIIVVIFGVNHGFMMLIDQC